MSNGNLTHRPALVLLSGLPGAGKTTFARGLLRLFAATHCESDAIRRELFPTPLYTPDEHARVFRVLERRAAEALAAGGCAIIDATNLARSDRRRFIRLGQRFDATFVAVRLVAPDAVIRARLSSPREGHSQADLRVYESMLGRSQLLSSPVLVANTSCDITPSLQLVARLLDEL